jgi:hypothetical protein
VIAPAHARALRLAREARARHESESIEFGEIDLSRYDAIIGAAS